ncbi:hypothetical protein [Kibdelosporangium philippinense]|uniref:hypothetical protein n=1 Tax=Kibdelosporangium philippinense TaxID=211113 RepID=UPI00361CDD2F
MPWWRISDLNADHGVLKVKVDGRDWWSRHARDIPNSGVLWHLAQQLRTTHYRS